MLVWLHSLGMDEMGMTNWVSFVFAVCLPAGMWVKALPWMTFAVLASHSLWPKRRHPPVSLPAEGTRLQLSEPQSKVLMDPTSQGTDLEH